MKNKIKEDLLDKIRVRREYLIECAKTFSFKLYPKNDLELVDTKFIQLDAKLRQHIKDLDWFLDLIEENLDSDGEIRFDNVIKIKEMLND